MDIGGQWKFVDIHHHGCAICTQLTDPIRRECELKHGMQAENGIICTSNMSGEMHVWRRRDARMGYSAAYPTCAERIKINRGLDTGLPVVIVSGE